MARTYLSERGEWPESLKDKNLVYATALRKCTAGRQNRPKASHRVRSHTVWSVSYKSLLDGAAQAP